MAIKISVVIPTYDRPQLLAVCLQALALQTLPSSDFEIIVVSDGPHSITKKTIGESSENLNITYFELPVKKGPAAARNMGWINAKANLIAFTDDDCRPDKYWLQHLLEAYKGEEKIAFTGKVIVPINGKPTDFEQNTAHLQHASFITANCCCTKQSLFLVGGFDERFFMAWREDSDLEFKLMLNEIPIVKLNNAIVVHPVRDAPWGISIKEQKKGMFNALLYKKFPSLYRHKIQPSPAWDYYAIVVLFLTMWLGIINGFSLLAIGSFISWFVLVALFIKRRLATTSHTTGHVVEMIATSFVIPFLSVYWQLYGAYKYRILFL